MFGKNLWYRSFCIGLSFFLLGSCLSGCSTSAPGSSGEEVSSYVSHKVSAAGSTPAQGSASGTVESTAPAASSGVTKESQSQAAESSAPQGITSAPTSGGPAPTNPQVNPQPEAERPCIVKTKYSTDDVVIADIIATDAAYGADGTGQKDSTQAIQKAINACYNAGGGTVFLPAGTYRVTGSLTVKAFVTLRGDWQDPDNGTDYGTVIQADVASSAQDLPALFNLMGSAGVMGLTVYYPHQNIDNVRPYPYTFYVQGLGEGYMLQSIVNCTVINGYKGIAACVSGDNAHEMLTVDTVKGTFLYRGATVYNQADVGTWKNLTFSNKYWAQAGSGMKRAERTKIDAYTRANAVGLALGDLEWTQFANIYVADYKYGIQIVKGKRIEFAGSLYNTTVERCGVGLQVDAIDTRWGMLVANSHIAGSERAVVNNTGGVVKLAGTVLSGGTSGGNIVTEEADLSRYTADYHAAPAKPKDKLYVVTADKSGASDAAGALQKVLDSAAKTGGVVYVPAGKYRLNTPLIVPAGVELRGASSVAVREQTGSSKGTVLLAYYGLNTGNPDTDTALVTLKAGAGVRGICFVYPENSCVRPGALGTVQPCAYTIRGQGAGVYAINVEISAGYNGIDFRGCSNHIIKKLVSCCYNNAIYAGNCSGGLIEGCLQNGTVLTRNGLNLPNWVDEGTQLFPYLFNKVTRVQTQYIKLSNAANQTIYNCFAYGVKDFVENTGSSNLTIFNIGADNIGGPMVVTSGGSAVIINMMRYNGSSFTNNGTALKIYNRLSINNKTESAVS